MEDHEFKLAALKTGLKHLFDKGHFSICDFDKLCDLANVMPPDDLKTTLNALHCVNYNQMSKELRDEMFDRIVEVFSKEYQGFDLNVIEESPPQVLDRDKKRGWWRRALSKSS